MRRLLLSGFVALAIAAPASAVAQPSPQAVAAGLIGTANALAARIRGYHRWQGFTPPPPGYCETMREGEAVVKELARIAGQATLYREPGWALRLQAAGDPLSDALDEEEEVNHQAGVAFTAYPCPTLTPHPARATVLRILLPRMPFCRMKATALRLSFAARRALMQQCLRLPGT
jgi:hypothetical protein